jgi:hypothetical protein
MFFGAKTQTTYTLEDRTLVIDASRLKLDERLEFKYDQHHNLIAIQKIKLSLFRERQEGRAETAIPPGGLGRVAYAGTSWKAYCDGDSKIEAGQQVLVMGRQDSVTLVVIAAG